MYSTHPLKLIPKLLLLTGFLLILVGETISLAEQYAKEASNDLTELYQ